MVIGDQGLQCFSYLPSKTPGDVCQEVTMGGSGGQGKGNKQHLQYCKSAIIVKILLISNMTMGYTFGRSNSFILVISAQQGSTLKGNNLLL